MTMTVFTCASCGASIVVTAETNARAHAEAKRDYGRDGRAADMSVICDDCYKAFKAWERRNTQ